ncbi:MAG: SxtJ family membrane protein [Opitutaceae bacterium]|nr:SxtJ family membrane protein [Opitutaceae bacterium]
MNPFREVNWQPGLGERRKFAVSLIVGFPCVAAVLLVAGRLLGTGWNFRAALTVGGVGVAVGLLLWAVPQIARPFYVGWYAVACGIGFMIGNGVLAAIYLLMFAPVGLAMRMVGRSGLSKGFDRSVSSYWRDAQPRDDPERYFRQY